MAVPEARVLIVEDDDILRILLFTVLRHQPLGVDTASSAEEAMEKVHACDYALILLDMDLPEDEAANFLRRFRQFRLQSTTFVLAVRNPKSELTIDPDLVSAVVNKPLEIDTLTEVVRECALMVPAPEEPLPCPPSESQIRERIDRGESSWPN